MAIKIIKSKEDLSAFHASTNGDSIGFVPTMGFLHEGHLDLVKQAQKGCRFTLCSIFVNPTQFNNPSDFDLYPRNTDRDVELLESVGCDAAFIPEPELVYPKSKPALLDYYDALFEVWEGKFRPGHFQGVVTVIERLFDLVRPSKAYFGLKDYQQYLVIKHAFAQLRPQVEIIGVETVREASGLAKSSRNERLSDAERNKAAAIIEALRFLAQSREQIEVKQACQQALEIMEQGGFQPEYITVADADNLKPLSSWGAAGSHAAMAAGFMGDVRLIDNLRF